MNETEEISTEEILTSIRNILLEKKEIVSKEDIFELTKEMIYKKSYKVDYDKVAGEIIKEFSFILDTKNQAQEQNVQELEKTEE